MKKSTAEEFIEALAWSEAPFEKLDLLLLELEGAEKEKYKEVLGRIVGCHYELIAAIVNEHPELDPEGEGKILYQKLKRKHEPSNT